MGAVERATRQYFAHEARSLQLCYTERWSLQELATIYYHGIYACISRHRCETKHEDLQIV